MNEDGPTGWSPTAPYDRPARLWKPGGGSRLPLQGILRDMGVLDLVQHACQEGKVSRLTVEHDGRTAAVFFEAGQVVHAELGDGQGAEAFFELMAWTEGAFLLEYEVTSPAQSIHRSSTGLLLEAAQRMDEGVAEREPAAEASGSLFTLGAQMEDPRRGSMNELVHSLAALEGVTGVVLVAEDGVVLADSLETDPEKEGAVAVFTAAAAGQAGASMNLGVFRKATLQVAGKTMLVLRGRDFYAGLLLGESASPAHVASRSQPILDAMAQP